MTRRKIRPKHELTGSAKTRLPRHFVFFDLETKMIPDGRGGHYLPFDLLTALHWRRGEKDREEKTTPYQTKDREAFWKWVASRHGKGDKLWVIAYNFNIDLPTSRCFSSLKALGWVMGNPYVNDRTKIFRFGLPIEKYAAHLAEDKDPKKWKGKKWQKTIELVDLANWEKAPLSEIALSLGTKKTEIDLQTATEAEIYEYCAQDTRILYLWMKEWLAFIVDNDFGSFGPTLGSQAMKAYTHRFMTYPIYLHNRRASLDLERASYHGGMTQVLYQGKAEDGPYYKLDVNGAYAWAMRSYDYPNKRLGYRKGPTLALLKEKLRQYHVVASVLLNITHPIYPAKVKGHTAYPLGIVKTTLTTPLLLEALSHGEVVRVYAMTWYDHADLFSEFVNYVLSQEKKCKVTISRLGEKDESEPLTDAERTELVKAKLRRRLLKFVRNMLYGKFAQRAIEIKDLGPLTHDFSPPKTLYGIDGEKIGMEFALAGRWWSQTSEGVGFNAFPAIAAEICDHLRIKLFYLIEKAGRENVLSCDTDGLIVNQMGLRNLRDEMDDYELGKLKIEATYPSIEILAPKAYRYPGGYTIKGIKKSATWIDPSTVIQERWPGLRKTLSTLHPDRLHVTRNRLTLNRKVHCGKVLPSGRVVPWVLPFADLEGIDLDRRERSIKKKIGTLRGARTLTIAYIDRHYHLVRGWIIDHLDERGDPVFWPRTVLQKEAAQMGYKDDRDLVGEILDQIERDRTIRTLKAELDCLYLYQEKTLSSAKVMTYAIPKEVSAQEKPKPSLYPIPPPLQPEEMARLHG